MKLAADKKIEIDVEDDESQLAKLLAYIKENSEGGHSFDIVVDPSDPDLAKKFYIDGDGAFRIRKIIASDSAPRVRDLLALDKDSVRSYDKDGRLRIARAHITKANICPYKGSEIPGFEELGLDADHIYQLYRDPDELKKAAATLNGVPLLRKHVPVSADDHRPHDVVGSLGTDAEFDGEYLDNSLFVNARDAIEGIESKKKRELSAGYHYRPEMTAGSFDGKRFDGVMRDIVFNHVSLVSDGRAGPDVIVGDSTEELMKKPTRLAALTLNLVAAHVSPLIAMDKKIELPKSLFSEITTKNFKAKSPALLAGVKQALDGKVRKGMTFDEGGLSKLLTALEESSGSGSDEEVTKEQEEAMESASQGKSNLDIPKTVVKEAKQDDDADADKDKAWDAEPIKEWMRGKGMSEDDISEVAGMFPKPATDEMDPDAMDAEEAPDEKAKKMKAEADKKKAEDTAKAKDSMKNMVTKPAMDAAIKLATDATAKSVRETERGIQVARSEVKPWVGELPLSLAFDSAEQVYRHALTMLGEPKAKTLHADALLPILQSKQKPGARPVEQSDPLGMDAATMTDLNTMVPGLDRIGAI